MNSSVSETGRPGCQASVQVADYHNITVGLHQSLSGNKKLGLQPEPAFQLNQDASGSYTMDRYSLHEMKPRPQVLSVRDTTVGLEFGKENLSYQPDPPSKRTTDGSKSSTYIAPPPYQEQLDRAQHQPQFVIGPPSNKHQSGPQYGPQSYQSAPAQKGTITYQNKTNPSQPAYNQQYGFQADSHPNQAIVVVQPPLPAPQLKFRSHFILAIVASFFCLLMGACSIFCIQRARTLDGIDEDRKRCNLRCSIATSIIAIIVGCAITASIVYARAFAYSTPTTTYYYNG